MARIYQERMTSEIEGDFVVFLIGFRANKWWKVWKWLPVARSMPRMIVELIQNPDLGLLHARSHFGFGSAMVVQYWRSFEHLHEYAVDRNAEHLPAWQAFNKAIGVNGDVGIWHETYLIKDGQYECIYGNMPAYGLGLAGNLVPAAGKARSARGRLRRTDGKDQPVMDDGAEAS